MVGAAAHPPSVPGPHLRLGGRWPESHQPGPPARALSRVWKGTVVSERAQAGYCGPLPMPLAPPAAPGPSRRPPSAGVPYTKLSTESFSLMECRHFFQLATAECTYSLWEDALVGRVALPGDPSHTPPWGPTYQPFWAPSHMVGAALLLAPAGSALGSGSGCAPPVSASGPFSLQEGWLLQGGPGGAPSRPPQPASPPLRRPRPQRAHLPGWAVGAGEGARSVKTCSVRGPGRTAAASASLGPESGTSVASVASSVD